MISSLGLFVIRVRVEAKNEEDGVSTLLGARKRGRSAVVDEPAAPKAADMAAIVVVIHREEMKCWIRLETKQRAEAFKTDPITR